MASTAMPNAINVAPNGRAYGATDVPLLGDPFGLALMETRNSCTKLGLYGIRKLKRGTRQGRRTDT
jgi:hypothetical protein